MATDQFCDAPFWRFVVATLGGTVLTFLDKAARERAVSLTLNAPAVASGVVPSDDPEINILHTDGYPFLSPGNRLLWGFRQENAVAGVYPGSGADVWVPRFGGIIQQVEDVADSDNANSTYTAFDPLSYLFSRPVVNFDGSFVGTNGISWTATQIEVVIGQIIRNTILNHGGIHCDLPATYGGTAFYSGTWDATTSIDVNFAQGTSVGEAILSLTNQDLVDVVLEPIWDPINRPGYVCEMSVYSQAGAVQDDAIFAWDRPSHSLVGMSRLADLKELANNVKYFAGTAGSASGGLTIPVQTDATSEATYGEYWRQQFWPAQNVASAVQALAAAALNLQKNGKTTVTISPIPTCTPLLFQEYGLGDRVPVYASDRFRQELGDSTGTVYQRIYGIPIAIADDATEIINNLLTSPVTGA